ncbi:F-box domain-containing protein [Mycena indigotica]|uniref:F-box domain-containing protein n=1 Tax=Mycena indigotica TaxID=2126181 RepID=A0A8H6SGS5_9AGAR|nr:F-box domain-containing protein [Mycena indigotica]KAF7298673.1 F-box domain-containing protein [Mycena indigotica]
MSSQAPASGLRLQIAAIEQEIASLLAQKAKLEETLATVPFPALSLPLDIARLIFHRVVPDHPSNRRIVEALKIAGVCTAWRDIVFTAPELWTTVAVKTGNVAMVQALDTWLPRTKGSAFKLIINFERDERVATAVWAAATRYSAQWQDVLLTTGDSLTLPLPNSLPALTALTIQGDLALECADGSTVDAPHFSHLSLDTPILMFQLGLPLEQVATLYLQGESYSGLIPILAKTPDVRDLTLDFSDSDGLVASAGASSPLVLTCLHTLEYNHDLPEAIVIALVLPVLHTLRFRSELPGPFNTVPTSQLLTMPGTGARRALRELEIGRTRGHTVTSQVMAWLAGLPTLTRLTICLDGFGPEDIATFCNEIAGGDLLPELETLLITHMKRAVEAQVLADVVERRWRWVGGGSRIKKFEVQLVGEDVLGYVERRLGSGQMKGLEYMISQGHSTHPHNLNMY